MAYPLLPAFADELTLSGTLAGGKTWAHVLHGRILAAGVGQTSAALMAAFYIEWGTAAQAMAKYLSSAVTLTKMECRQIAAVKSRVGRLAQFTLTTVAGSVTTAAITDPGGGYVPTSTFTVPILESTNAPGGGGVLIATVGPLGTVTGVAVSIGGAGYNLPYAENVPPGLLEGEQFFDKVYGASDILVPVALPGGVATDVSPFFNAFSLQFRCALPGRNGKGSGHLPGVPEASTLSQVLTAGVQAAMGGDVDLVYRAPTPVGASSYQLGVFSPTLFSRFPPTQYVNAPTRQGTSSTLWYGDITSAILNPHVGSMLRRKVRN